MFFNGCRLCSNNRVPLQKMKSRRKLRNCCACFAEELPRYVGEFHRTNEWLEFGVGGCSLVCFGRNHGNVINSTEGLGLLIADEGHRLKNSAETKTTKALKACPAIMRLVLVSFFLLLYHWMNLVMG